MSDGRPDWIGDPYDAPTDYWTERTRRCLHCGNGQTLKGVPLTGRFCSPTCLREHQREWGNNASSDWRGIEE